MSEHQDVFAENNDWKAVALSAGAAALVLTVAYFTPRALNTEEVARGTVTVQHGEPAGEVVDFTCDKLVGAGNYDHRTSVQASQMLGPDGLMRSIQFEHPQNTDIVVVCASYGWPVLNGILP